MLSVKQAAEQLGITPPLVRRYCEQGRIKAEKVGRDWVITQAALNSFARKVRRVGRPKRDTSKTA